MVLRLAGIPDVRPGAGGETDARVAADDRDRHIRTRHRAHGAAAGNSQACLVELERGTHRSPRAYLIEQFAQALSLKTDVLYFAQI